MKMYRTRDLQAFIIAFLGFQFATIAYAGTSITNLSLNGVISPSPSSCNFGAATFSTASYGGGGVGQRPFAGQGVVPITCSSGSAYTVSTNSQSFESGQLQEAGNSNVLRPSNMIYENSSANDKQQTTSISMIGNGIKQHITVLTDLPEEETDDSSETDDTAGSEKNADKTSKVTGEVPPANVMETIDGNIIKKPKVHPKKIARAKTDGGVPLVVAF